MMDFDANSAAAAYKLSKFKIPKKVGATGSSTSLSGSNYDAGHNSGGVNRGGVPSFHSSPGLPFPSPTTNTKKLYHKSGYTASLSSSATSHLKPYLKPRPQKTPKKSLSSSQKKIKNKDPLYSPFGKTTSSASSATSSHPSSDHPSNRQKTKIDRYHEDLYDNVELEQQFVLRLPVAAAASLRAALQSEASDIKDRLGIEFQQDLRKASVRWDGYIYPARFQVRVMILFC